MESYKKGPQPTKIQAIKDQPRQLFRIEKVLRPKEKEKAINLSISLAKNQKINDKFINIYFEGC